jgi:hypothetical protein
MLVMLRIVPAVVAILGQADPKEQARQFLVLCQAAKFTEATANFDATMKEVLPPENLAQIWEGITKQYGKVEKVGPPRTERVQDSTRVKLRCEFKSIPLDTIISFNAKGQIEGFFLAPAEKTAGTPGPSYADPNQFDEAPITVGARDWPLPGTLTRPKGVSSPPLIILVHGSGPNDRDETIGPNTPFRDLAQGLASRGMAVLRYDKRTFAHKARLAKDPKAVAEMTMNEEVIEDALATIAQARNLSGIDVSRVFVLGHSEGGTLTPLIAKRER